MNGDPIMTLSDALRWICTEALREDVAIDEDRYCYGLDVLHAHEIESPQGKTLVRYRYLGEASRSGPFTGKIRTNLPLEKGHQFRWRWGIAEVTAARAVT